MKKKTSLGHPIYDRLPPDSPAELIHHTSDHTAGPLIRDDQPTQVYLRSKSRHDTPIKPGFLSPDTRAMQCLQTQDQAFTPPAESSLDPAHYITDPDLLHFWQTQMVPPDPNAGLVDPAGYDKSPRILPTDKQPTQERSPSATKPKPSPHESRLPSPSKPPSPRSPIEWVYTNAIDYEFGRRVCDAYEQSKRRDKERADMYGEEVASKWKRGSTPESVQIRHNAVKWEEYKRAWDLSPAQPGDWDWVSPKGPADTGVDSKPNGLGVGVSIREPGFATSPHESLARIQLPSHCPKPQSDIPVSQPD
ncbi:MAG: hypothetical protein L6R41_000597 [Letrouitia leprolyta]|nr:MAG: hypothetical protein L6R41_000597 [Letrouitia leprolyta]